MPSDVSSFSTREVRVQTQNFKTFTTSYPASIFPIGINLIDFRRERNVRLRAYSDNVSPADSDFDKFKADFHLDTWGDSVLYAAGCCWLDVSKHCRDFQFGSFQTGHLPDNATGAVLDVKFEGQYGCVPKIVVWLNTIDMERTEEQRILALASDVTTKGFKLRVGTWGPSEVYDSRVSWIAVPYDRPNMTAGQFTTQGSGSASTEITFDKRFTHAPRVLVALNKIDASKNTNLRIQAKAENITKDGMTLSIETWSGTVLHGAGASWIAIEEFSSAV